MLPRSHLAKSEALPLACSALTVSDGSHYLETEQFVKLISDIVSLGSLIGTFVTWAANQAWGGDVLDNRGWKVPLYVGLAAPTTTLIAMALLMPESPYWLILKDRIEDAKRSLQRLHPNKSPAEIASAMAEAPSGSGEQRPG